MRNIISIIISILICITGTACKLKNEVPEDIVKKTHEYDPETINSKFGFQRPNDLSEMINLGAFWQRPHLGPFIWGHIEKQQGEFNWSYVDSEVNHSQYWGINILATIWPFADWDQSSCHQEFDGSQYSDWEDLGIYRQIPCNLDAYKLFVEKLVERYDGDGIDDMPDLQFPIKYWEVSNEPQLQESPTFFVGTPEEYFKILKTTYNGVKNADISAKVLHGGMAGLGDDDYFWDDVLTLGGANFFDIGNIHCVGCDSESLYGIEFFEFLNNYNIDKPFWITELNLSADAFGDSEFSKKEWADYLITHFVQAFSGGAEKIFFSNGLGGFTPSDRNAWLIDGVSKQEIYYAYKTIVDKLDYFSSVEKITQDQYRFIVNTDTIYVLWGTGNVPNEINGEVIVTAVDGTENTMNSSEIIVLESPIFVEVQ